MYVLHDWSTDFFVYLFVVKKKYACVLEFMCVHVIFVRAREGVKQNKRRLEV